MRTGLIASLFASKQKSDPSFSLVCRKMRHLRANSSSKYLSTFGMHIILTQYEKPQLSKGGNSQTRPERLCGLSRERISEATSKNLKGEAS